MKTSVFWDRAHLYWTVGPFDLNLAVSLDVVVGIEPDFDLKVGYFQYKTHKTVLILSGCHTSVTSSGL